MLVRRYYQPRACFAPQPGGSGAMTWDSSNKAATDTLSGGDLIVTNSAVGTGDNTHGLHSRAQTTGQFYFEILVGTTVPTNNFAIGVCRTTVSTTGYLGVPSDSVGWYIQGGNVLVENATAATIQTAASNGTYLGIAVDLTTSKIWFRSSGNTNWNNDVIGNQNPAVGSQVGGIDISGITGAGVVPAIGLTANSLVATANFGGTAYNMTAPSGFGNW